MSTAGQTARLSKEAIGYVLGAPRTSTKESPSHAAVLSLSNPNASSPLASLRGTTPVPSASSFSVATTTDSVASLFVHADRGRTLIHVHVFHPSASSGPSSSSHTSCPLTARLHPPEPTPALALSPCGTMLAAGAQSGRLYVWHLGSGRLLASVDAHFRAVTCMEWSACGRSLVTGSEDARILVWSLEALVSETATTVGVANEEDGPLTTSIGASGAKPYAILADHVQGISALTLSSSSRSSVASFPASMRIMSASFDGSVKLWDVRSRALVATWSFSGPVKHLVVDVGFRSFFAVVSSRAATKGGDEGEEEEEDLQEYDWVRKVDLFSSSSSSAASSSAASQFNAGSDSTFSTSVYQAVTGIRITALAISMAGSHLLLGMSNAQMITVDVQSSVAIRTSSLLAAGQARGAVGASQVEVVSLTTFLMEDSSSLLLGSSGQGKGAGVGGGKFGREWAFTIAEKLQRTITSPAERGATFAVRLTKRNIEATLAHITPPSLAMAAAGARVRTPLTSGKVAKKGEEDDGQETKRKLAQLERDNEKLNELLKRAQKTNAELWERVVRDAVDTPSQTANSAPMQVDRR